ncbi:MAG: flagellar export chaperone FlgN [Parahaliea sp.]
MLTGEQLNSQLGANLAALGAVEEALEAERRALIGKDAAILESATAIKTDSLAHYTQHNASLQQLLADNEPLSAVIGQLDRVEDNRALAQELASLADRCQAINRGNGRLIAELQTRARGALDILRNRESDPALYCALGTTALQKDTRLLGQA